MTTAYYEKNYDGELDVSIRSQHPELTELDSVFFQKVVDDIETLKDKSKNLMAQYLDLNKPCFDGGPQLFSIEITGVAATVYRVYLEYVFENDSNVYWSVLFNVPMLSPPLEKIQQSNYWPIELSWRVE
ncbi:hypothetical protein [Acinetobacter sp. TR3]|uniref:hypothetical protein n=1 Tax=Acinetobacter sp. TR3 TaxID=3003392 RepID=UPI0022AC8835|nr:hypothetical protein [Acinetobacter sp. TR3]WAU76341.1 hypothetical protein O1449_13925 [Acinetobacter sp. TR3]